MATIIQHINRITNISVILENVLNKAFEERSNNGGNLGSCNSILVSVILFNRFQSLKFSIKKSSPLQIFILKLSSG